MPDPIGISSPIVYVANRVPWPLDDGWKRRTFALLKGIAASRDVTFVAPSPGDASLILEFQRECGSRVTLALTVKHAPLAPLRAMLASLGTGRSPLSMRHFTGPLAAEVVRSVERCKAKAVFYVGAFLAEVHTATPQLYGIPFVVDTHNIDSHAMMRRVRDRMSLSGMATTVVGHLLRAAEARVFGEAAATLVCSEPEVSLVRALCSFSRPHVVPNGVDTDLFSVAAPRAADGVVRLLFFGNLDYPPNVDAMRYLASEILPALRATGIPFLIVIVGSGEGALVRSLMSGLSNVEFVGRVSNVAEAIHAADAVVVPLRSGGGTRLKILEALAAGRLVISTAVGAEGIGAVHGQHLWIANSPAEFASALSSFAQNPGAMTTIARSGAELVRARYSWSAIQVRIDEVLTATLGSRSGSSGSGLQTTELSDDSA